jgi:histone H3/H4
VQALYTTEFPELDDAKYTALGVNLGALKQNVALALECEEESDEEDDQENDDQIAPDMLYHAQHELSRLEGWLQAQPDLPRGLVVASSVFEELPDFGTEEELRPRLEAVEARLKELQEVEEEVFDMKHGAKSAVLRLEALNLAHASPDAVRVRAILGESFMDQETRYYERAYSADADTRIPFRELRALVESIETAIRAATARSEEAATLDRNYADAEKSWREQHRTGLAIEPRKFKRLANELLANFRSDYRFEPEALEALQTATEAFGVGLFEDVWRAAFHAGRNEQEPTGEDLRLALAERDLLR